MDVAHVLMRVRSRWMDASFCRSPRRPPNTSVSATEPSPSRAQHRPCDQAETNKVFDRAARPQSRQRAKRIGRQDQAQLQIQARNVRIADPVISCSPFRRGSKIRSPGTQVGPPDTSPDRSNARCRREKHIIDEDGLAFAAATSWASST